MRFLRLSHVLLEIYEAFFTAIENWGSDELNNTLILLLSLTI